MPVVNGQDNSGSVVTALKLEPSAKGSLDGLTFTVKDNIDIKGHRTSYGSPAWREAHLPPKENAVCVDQLLAEGARCVGKVVADEFTYSLDGESQFFGTPRNAKAPDRIPGGSSSGSASSVGHGIAHFSICTDSGGSIRVPASLCGLWGMRPSLHRLSEAGVLPFMPSVSTVGVIADSLAHLALPMQVLLRSGRRKPRKIERLFVLTDAMAVADPEVAEQANAKLEHISSRTGIPVHPVSFSEITKSAYEFTDCNLKALRDLQTLEFQNTVGNWIETTKPELGFTFSMAYGNVQSFNRQQALKSLEHCEQLFEAINAFLTPGSVICFPTTPVIAPMKGSLNTMDAVLDFYDRTMTITAFSGVARLPEISAPLLSTNGCPVGLSFAASHYQDEFLLSAVNQLLA